MRLTSVAQSLDTRGNTLNIECQVAPLCILRIALLALFYCCTGPYTIASRYRHVDIARLPNNVT